MSMMILTPGINNYVRLGSICLREGATLSSSNPVSYLSSQPHTEEILLTRNSTLEKLNARLNGDHESAQLLWYSRNCSEHLIL